MFEAIQWREDRLILLNQLKLPFEEVYEEYTDYRKVGEAIAKMVVRGAPAIGITAAFGLVLSAMECRSDNFSDLAANFEEAARYLAKTRPTAVNLFWAIDRMKKRFYALEGLPREEIVDKLLQEAQNILEEDRETNRKIGEFGAQYVKDGDTIMTYCNAGALATGGYGTATAVIRVAREQGKNVRVIACETRPYLQGARLTVWELMKDHIDVTLITDNMAGYLLSSGEVNLCVVGTDRTARNGDVANKIGTYMLALAARESGVPFYVAAPTSSIDLSISSGKEIPIEERSPEEVVQIAGKYIAPPGTKARHIAFDVTPHRLVTAFFTERGVALPPFQESLPKLVEM